MKEKIKKNKILIGNIIAVFIICVSLLFPLNSNSAVDNNTVRSIVKIRCITDEGSWYGSGVIISSDGYVITNKHVVSGASGTIYTNCEIAITEGSSLVPNFLYKAETITSGYYTKGINSLDLALLKIETNRNDFPYTEVYTYGFPEMGVEIYALGYPVMGGDTITYTEGYVSGASPISDDLPMWFIKSDIKLDAGNSGGGVFTNNNEFVGIATAILIGEYNNLGLIIPALSIRDFLYINSYESLIHGEKIEGTDQIYQYRDNESLTTAKPFSASKYPDGTLVYALETRTPGTYSPVTVYLIENGYKRPFPNHDILIAHGYEMHHWDPVTKTITETIVDITLEELHIYPLGLPMTMPIAENSVSEISEGALIRRVGGMDIYIVKYVDSKKFKRLILNPDVFNMYGHLKWENVMDVDQSVVNSFTTSELVRSVGDDKIYKLYPEGDTGIKRYIKTTEAFNRNGWDQNAIYEINQFDRDSYITGSSIE